MLVLTRKQQEKIQIGENITITVLKMKGKTVRLGIEAPGSVTVLRGELAAKTHQSTAEVETVAEPIATPSGEPTERDPAWRPAESQSETTVLTRRVPRSRVSTVLPKVLGEKMREGGGPLRAMLDRRPGVQV